MKYCKIFTFSLLLLLCQRIDVSAQCTSYPSGTDIIKGPVFNGDFNAGTPSDPDEVCPKNKIIYELKPPNGYSNAQFGATWAITSLTFRTANGTDAKDTILTLPSAANGNGKLTFIPRTTFADSTFILTAVVQALGKTCDTVLTRFIHVAPQPDADFLPSANLICLGDIVSFSDNSSGSGLTRLWDFGDGSKSTVTNPNYAYPSPGTYKVWLKVTNSNGCQDSMDETIIVSPYPDADFTISDTSACVGQEITFTNTSTKTDLASYEYKFGDDSIAVTENAAHAYAAAGTYDVWLIVSNGPGCMDSIKKQVTVSARPTVSFTGSDVCLGTATTFTNTSSSGTGITYLWNFGDGNNSTDQNPSHTFSTADSFTVWLHVTGPGGCTDSISKTVKVLSVTADFNMSPSAGCNPVTVNFTDQSSGATISDYLWVFGDGDSSTDQNPTHQFNTAGSYSVILYVTSSDGCKDSITKNVISYEIPVATFTFDTTFLSVTFEADEDESGAVYSWDFGDGNTSISKNPTHVYDSAGTYEVKLKVTSGSGCESESSDSVTVTEPVGIREIDINLFSVTVYPNPFSDKVSIDYELKQPAFITLSLYDVNGRLILTKHRGRTGAGKHSITIRGELADGAYVVHLAANDKIVTRQVFRIGK